MMSMSDLLFFIGLVAAAACFALMEIQIEGPAGWARNLPTWRIRDPRLLRLMERVMPGRPLTGYHVWIILFIALVAHLPFLVFGLPWSWRGELRSLSFIALFWVLEDFLWFVLNPHYGLRRFRPQYIAWHQPAWWWIAPRDYWIGLVVGLALYLASRPQPVVYEIVMRAP